MSTASDSLAALSADDKMALLRALVQDILSHQARPQVFALYTDDDEAVAYIIPAVLRPMTEVDLSAGLAELENPDDHIPIEEIFKDFNSSSE